MNKEKALNIMKDIDLQGHKLVFCNLHGSHARKINTPNSDKDYKVFVLPTLDDLYESKYFCCNYHAEDIDIEVKDIRKLPDYIYGCNPSGLDILYPTDYYVDEDFEFIFDYMEEAFSYNPYKTFMATYGTYQKIRKNFNKYPNKSNKNAANLYFFCSVAEYIFGNKRYSTIIAPYLREIIINIKTGHYTASQLEFLINEMDDTMELMYQKRDELPEKQNDSYDKFKNEIKYAVLENITSKI